MNQANDAERRRREAGERQRNADQVRKHNAEVDRQKRLEAERQNHGRQEAEKINRANDAERKAKADAHAREIAQGLACADCGRTPSDFGAGPKGMEAFRKHMQTHKLKQKGLATPPAKHPNTGAGEKKNVPPGAINGGKIKP